MRSLSSDNYYRGRSLPQQRGEESRRRLEEESDGKEVARTATRGVCDFISADIERV
jgi:hypothetical protein